MSEWTVERLEASEAYQQLLGCLTEEGREFLRYLAKIIVEKVQQGRTKVDHITTGQYFAGSDALVGHLEAFERGDHRIHIQERINIYTHFPNESKVWAAIIRLLPMPGTECPGWNEQDYEVADAIRSRYVRRLYIDAYDNDRPVHTDTYEVEHLTADLGRFRLEMSRGLDLEARLAAGHEWVAEQEAWMQRFQAEKAASFAATAR